MTALQRFPRPRGNPSPAPKQLFSVWQPESLTTVELLFQQLTCFALSLSLSEMCLSNFLRNVIKMLRNGTRESIDEDMGKYCIFITAAGPTVLCQVSALLLCCLFVTQHFRCFLVICNTLKTAYCSYLTCVHPNPDFDMFDPKT